MADSHLVLCPALCFLLNRINRLELNVLKKTLLEFYTPADITMAKQQMMDDAENLNLTEKLPRLPHRNIGDNKTEREVDDILTLCAFLDERKILSTLPTYTADSPDAMPYMRMVDADFQYMFRKMGSMEDLMGKLIGMFDALVSRTPSYCAQEQTKGVNVGTSTEPDYADIVKNPPQCSQQRMQEKHDVRAKDAISGTVNKPVGQSAPSRNAHLPSTTRADVAHVYTGGSTLRQSWEQQMNAAEDVGTDTDTDGPYTLVRSDKKRRRGADNQLQDKNRAPAAPATTVLRQSKKPLMVGRQTGLTQIKLTAAKSLVHRAFYYVDNLSTSVSIDDLTNFVKSLDVRVISCFKANARRTRKQRSDKNFVAKRNSFRLCINDEDSHKLLVAESWPEDVVVNKWYFKESTAAASHDEDDDSEQPAKRQELALSPIGGANVGAASDSSPPTAHGGGQAADGDEMDMASTVIRFETQASLDSTIIDGSNGSS